MKRSEMKIGSSSCFTGSLTEEVLAPLAKAGLDYLEYTGNYVFFMRTYDFPKNAEKILETVRASGLEPWSFHLPFSRKLDISNPDKELRAVTIVTNRTLIEAAARAGAKVIVLHPSSEPIDDEARPERMRLAREAIIELAECAKEPEGNQIQESVDKSFDAELADSVLPFLVLYRLFRDSVEAGIFCQIRYVAMHFTIYLYILYDFVSVCLEAAVHVMQLYACYLSCSGIVEL